MIAHSCFAVPVNRGFHPGLGKLGREVWADDVCSKGLLLEELEMAKCWPWVDKILDIWRTRPVSEVGEVGDKSWLGKELLGGEMVEI